MAKKTGALRKAAAYVVGAGLVVIGLELGSPSAPEAQAAGRSMYWGDGEMPESPGAMEYPLGEGMAVNGVPIRMSYYQVKMEPDRLRDHYVDALVARGLAPQVQVGVGGGWTVTALAESGHEQIVIAIMGQGPNKALVFPSIVPLGVAPGDNAQKFLDDLPLSPAAMGALTVTSSDKPGEAVITYQEPEQSAGATATFIRDDMGKRGWTLVEFNAPKGQLSSWSVEGQHGARRARFTVSSWPKSESGATVVVQLSAVE